VIEVQHYAAHTLAVLAQHRISGILYLNKKIAFEVICQNLRTIRTRTPVLGAEPGCQDKQEANGRKQPENAGECSGSCSLVKKTLTLSIGLNIEY